MVLSVQVTTQVNLLDRSWPFQGKYFDDLKALGHEELSTTLAFDRPGNWGGLYLKDLGIVLVVAFLFQHEVEILPVEEDADPEIEVLKPLYQVYVIKDKGYVQVDIPPGAGQAHATNFGDPYMDLGKVQEYLSESKVRKDVLMPCVHLHMGVIDCFKVSDISYV